ncbi:MAG: hypothetical protein L0Y66_06955 [Myxococcaceae bacterium]|nr:hypothetical protein [Myxococcaceae bacterium]MCI0670918.1 hypothetical protein [Myxococcaceae bacterium]
MAYSIRVPEGAAAVLEQVPTDIRAWVRFELAQLAEVADARPLPRPDWPSMRTRPWRTLRLLPRGHWLQVEVDVGERCVRVVEMGLPTTAPS